MKDLDIFLQNYALSKKKKCHLELTFSLEKSQQIPRGQRFFIVTIS